MAAMAAVVGGAITAARSASAGEQVATGLFSLADYEGDGDARFAAALAACVAAGGGTIFIPAGDWHISTTHECVVAGDNELSIRFVGLGSSSRVFVECGSALDAFYFGNLKHASFADVTFIGGTDGVDCSSVLNFASVRSAIVERCNFHGLGGAYDLVHANFAALKVSECGFFGCGTRSAGAIGINENMRSVEVSRTEFLDVHAPIAGATVSGKANDSLCWIRILDYTSGLGWGGLIRIANCHFDEHAKHAVLCAPRNPATRHRQIEIVGCSQLASAHADGCSIQLAQVDALLIESFATIVTVDRPYLRLSDVREARIRRCRVETDEGVTSSLVADHLTTFA